MPLHRVLVELLVDTADEDAAVQLITEAVADGVAGWEHRILDWCYPDDAILPVALTPELHQRVEQHGWCDLLFALPPRPPPIINLTR